MSEPEAGKEMGEELRDAFRDARSDDVLVRIAAWALLERAELAQSYLVGGRFFQLSLTDEGRRLRDEFEKRLLP